VPVSKIAIVCKEHDQLFRVCTFVVVVHVVQCEPILYFFSEN